MARSASETMALSVTSTLSRPAGRLARTSRRATDSARSVSSRLRIEMLTATCTGVAPGDALGDGRFEHEVGQGTDQAGVFGEGHELVRRDVAPHRMPPPQQGLDTWDLSRLGVGLGLVVHLEPALFEGTGEVADERETTRAVGVTRGRVLQRRSGRASRRTSRPRHAAGSAPPTSRRGEQSRCRCLR